MNIVLISQCTKQALKETRRIVDQFAERRGERTWQTSISYAGLDTLRKLLRKTARKNTAVACHWVRAKDHTELLWVVGNSAAFNDVGAVPTDSTSRNVLNSNDENNWHKLSYMGLLCGLASLLHDVGKSCQAFQQRLHSRSILEKNRYRHEWVSVRLWQAFVGQDSDEAWLEKLLQFGAAEACGREFERLWLGSATSPLWRDGIDAEVAKLVPFSAAPAGLPPLAQTIAWLVLTHHRLPARHDVEQPNDNTSMYYGKPPKSVPRSLLPSLLQQVDADWNEPWPSDTSTADPVPYWSFPHGLPVRTQQWRQRAARIAKALSRHTLDWPQGLSDPYVMHVSRLSLMLADHYYSSLKDKALRVKGEAGFPLHANTDRVTRKPLQALDEHLLGVEHHAAKVMRSLPGLRASLPHLLKHKGLRKRSQNARFRWQDKATDMAEGLRPKLMDHGVFIVNMASTGCGKTLANARIMNALSLPEQGLRCAFAMGLRTLTLQTGRSFQKNLQLGDEELAIQVGGAAQKELFTYYEQLAEQSGSASVQDLLDETGHIVYDADLSHPVLQQLSTSPAAQKLLQAPLLVCTVDHLIPATESLRGGRQIAPMLRLLSSDLVLDEPDDFDLADLPALSRLVHWAGLLGTRVLLSSATLTPALVQGLFLAYRAGRQWYQRNRGARPEDTAQLSVLWVDEFEQKYALAVSDQDFLAHHAAFVERRSQHLATKSSRQWAHIINMPPTLLESQDKDTRRKNLAALFLQHAVALHKAHHSVDPHSGKQVSFGLIRMANIGPLYEVAQAMCQLGAQTEAMHIHLCVYHSQYPLIMRSAIETHLDQVLSRHDEQAVFELPPVQDCLRRSSAQQHLFIVLGSPVTEVGRDHDYDWAIVEPSSIRSIIQLSGRVLRHRPHKQPIAPNIYLCNYNVRHMDNLIANNANPTASTKKKAAFCRPGFEAQPDYVLRQHDLKSLLRGLLDEKRCFVVDAQPRIQARPEAERQPDQSLIDLEHYRLEREMLPESAQQVPADKTLSENASLFWHTQAMHLLGFAQQRQAFREQTLKQIELVFLPDEDEESLLLHRVDERKSAHPDPYILIDQSLCHPVQLSMRESISFWGSEDLSVLLERQAEAMDLSLKQCAVRFATVTLPTSDRGWDWHPKLGFKKTKA